MATRLQLRLANATFAKDCSYFIAVQYGEGDAVQKFRTEVSESTSTPVFGRSTFDIALPAAALQDGAAQHGQLRRDAIQLALFVMLPSGGGGGGGAAGGVQESQPPSETKLLGRSSLELSAAALLRGETVSAQVTFVRRPRPGKEVPVGRVSVELALSNAEQLRGAVPEAVGGSSSSSSSSSSSGGGGGAQQREARAARHAADEEGLAASPATGRTVLVLVHSAANLPARAQSAEAPRAAVELRVTNVAQTAVALGSGAEPTSRAPSSEGFFYPSQEARAPEVRRQQRAQLEAAAERCPSAARTATAEQGDFAPRWNELLVARVPDGAEQVRLDICDDVGGGSNGKAASIIACAYLPLSGLMPQHDYTTELQFAGGITLTCTLLLCESVVGDEALFGTAGGQRLELLVQEATGLRSAAAASSEAAAAEQLWAVAQCMPAAEVGGGSGGSDGAAAGTMTALTRALADASQAPEFPLSRVSSTEQWSRLVRKNRVDASVMQSLRKLSPAAELRGRAGDEAAVWGFPFVFDFGSAARGVPVAAQQPAALVDTAGEPTTSVLVHLFARSGANIRFAGFAPVHMPRGLRPGGETCTVECPLTLVGAQDADARLRVRLRLWDSASLVRHIRGDVSAGFYLGSPAPLLRWFRKDAASQPLGRHLWSLVGLEGLVGAQMAEWVQNGGAMRSVQNGHGGLLDTESTMVPVEQLERSQQLGAVDGGDTLLVPGQRLTVLTRDIAHKQTLIDRLMKEVDRRSLAIRSCGVEIVELRRQKLSLMDENVDLRRDLQRFLDKEQEQREQLEGTLRAAQAAGAAAPGAPHLVQQLSLASERLQEMEGEKEQLMQRLAVAGRSVAAERETRAALERLQHAHAQQSAHLQKAQSEASKLAVYKVSAEPSERGGCAAQLLCVVLGR